VIQFSRLRRGRVFCIDKAYHTNAIVVDVKNETEKVEVNVAGFGATGVVNRKRVSWRVAARELNILNFLRLRPA
jgi:hypothetical protein